MQERIRPDILAKELAALPKTLPPHLEQQITALKKHTERNEFTEDVRAHSLKATDIGGNAIPKLTAQIVLLSGIFGLQKTIQIFEDSKKSTSQ